MKKYFSILCLLSVIAFAGASFNRSDGGGGGDENTNVSIENVSQSFPDAGVYEQAHDIEISPVAVNENFPVQIAKTDEAHIAVPCGQGFRCSDSQYENNMKFESWCREVFKPGTNT